MPKILTKFSKLKPSVFFYTSVLIVLLFMPVIVKGAYYRHIIIFTLMYIVLAHAWNLIGGYTGQIALGNVVFFGIGAYTSSLLMASANITPWAGMWLGGLLAAIVALFLGTVMFRLRGHYFAMGTLALGELTRLSFTNWKFVGGAQGISLPIHIPSVYYMEWSSKVPYYYIILALAMIVTIFVKILDKSRFGIYSKALKQDEVAARNRGINTFRLKQLAFGLNAFITALAGTFYAQYIMYISPASILALETSILIAVIPIVGGLGTTLGPILGTVFIFPLTEFLRAEFGGQATGINYILFGLAIVFVVLIEPFGFVALVKSGRRSITLIIKKLRGDSLVESTQD